MHSGIILPNGPAVLLAEGEKCRHRPLGGGRVLLRPLLGLRLRPREQCHLRLVPLPILPGHLVPLGSLLVVEVPPLLGHVLGNLADLLIATHLGLDGILHRHREAYVRRLEALGGRRRVLPLAQGSLAAVERVAVVLVVARIVMMIGSGEVRRNFPIVLHE